VTFRVPGNLILMGEYAVLEDEGLAVTAAVYPCAEGTLSDQNYLTGRQGGRAWSVPLSGDTDEQVQNHLPSFCRTALSEYCRDRGLTLSPQGVHVDTESMASGGRKLGYGSSAAAAVAFVRGMLAGQAWNEKITESDIRAIACRAHNRFQGKAGSGYDVYTSSSTGINLFSQGNPPRIDLLHLPFLPDLYLYYSSRSISTVHSVKGYRVWKNNHPADAAEYLQSTNALIREFVACTHWRDGQEILKKAGVLGRMLGDVLGVTADVEVPEEIHGIPDTVWKASGAGNELVLIVSPHDLNFIPGVEKVRLFYG